MTAPNELTGLAFTPEQALGWRDIGLDGLSCYLRCVEAVLMWRGFGSLQTAQTLAGPLDLLHPGLDGSPFGAFPHLTVEWRYAEPGGDLWEEVRASLRDSEPVILCPDGYGWPGDEFLGTRHAYHHMVLPVEERDGALWVLDTDAPKSDGFRRRVPVTESVTRAFDRVGLIKHGAPLPVRPADSVARELLPESVRTLRQDIADLAGFLERWKGGSIPAMTAHGLHVVVLGDFQPQLFLLKSALGTATAAGDGLDDLRASLDSAARRAKKLGLLLTGLHRFGSDDLYALCHAEFGSFVDGLRAVLAAAESWLGTPAPGPAPQVSGRLARRLGVVTEWCFGEPAEESEAWALAPEQAGSPSADEEERA